MPAPGLNDGRGQIGYASVVEGPSQNSGGPSWLPHWLEDCPESAALSLALGVALAIRLYLSLTSYCIAGDGVAYLGMARDFAAGEPAKALDNVFSPLYPYVVSLAHSLVTDWEVAGNLVSALLGTAAIATVYYMTREVFERRDLAFGAAALAAIHPELAAYSASVRTEAGFFLLMTGAMCALVMSLKRHQIALAAAAGAVGGLAYLYRTEALGLLIFGPAFIPFGVIWRRWGLGWAFCAAGLFAAAFLLVASPYIIYLRISTGHWMVSREFTAAMMYGMGDAARNGDAWRALGYSKSVSPLAPLFANPKLYLEKVSGELVMSFYYFAQALGPVLSVMLILGLWRRGRRVFSNFGEAMLALITLFYVFGFAFSYGGVRFMVHLIPYTFGWVVIGIEAASDAFRRAGTAAGWRLPQGVLAGAIALALIPQTLWPIGYDMRGVRYAGEEIARRSDHQPRDVVARDGRVAYYAGARFILMPNQPGPDFCRWLTTHDDAGYLMIGEHDELRFKVAGGAACLKFLKRYPRYGSSYYDLFEIQHAN